MSARPTLEPPEDQRSYTTARDTTPAAGDPGNTRHGILRHIPDSTSYAAAEF